MCAKTPWSFSSACKNWSRQLPLGAEISYSQKVDLGESESRCSAVLLGDQSSPDFFRRTREESLSITCLSDFGYLYPFRRYSRSNLEVVRNQPKFCTFLAPTFVRGGPPKFWDLIYQIHQPSDNVVKFRGDRLTELGDLALKNKKERNISSKTSPTGTTIPGGLTRTK